MRWIRAAVVLGVVSTAGPIGAQAPPKAAGVVDGRFDAIARVMQAEGPRSAYFGGRGMRADVRQDGVAAMLRFANVLSKQELAELEAAGVEWQRRDGRLVRVGDVYGAFVRFDALAALRAHRGLVFAEVAWHPVTVQPLEVTTAEIGADRARLAPIEGADGSGALIGDLDSGLDVLHPHFFFADGGAFAWLDTDGDGVFSPGADHVDLDRDGEGTFNEVARVLDQATFFQGDVTDRDGELDPAIDWLYIDANQDLERNVGRAAGFTEFDPGYGEPAFVPDDANRNGVLDVDERVLLLDTSKVRRFVSTERTYVRGEDLIDAAAIPFIDQVFHGSAVASILAGGHPTRRRSGIAPGAELVMYSAHMDAQGGTFEEPGQLAGIAGAVDDGCDVLVHEWTNPYTAPMDGSGNLEEAMLNARAAGVVQINPVGNMNLSEKHTEVDVVAGTPTTMTFVVGDGFAIGGDTYPYSSLYGSVYWRTDQQPTFVLRNPDGVELTLDGSSDILTIGPNNVQGLITESLRGTWQLRLTIWNANFDIGVVAGDWELVVTATAPDRFVGRIADFWSGWARGVRWANPTQDYNTAVYPSTADAAFGVAAYGGRFAIEPDGSEVGELRNYSGRGPRIDGARIVDIAAPDDPFAAWGVSPAWVESGAGRSWFTPFGGTSGAAPHVAGTVALMRGIDPAATVADIEARLLASARADAQTPTLPDAAWGEGKLDAYAAVFGMSAEPNTPPVAELELVGAMLSASGSADSDADPLTFRWDFDYDGTWDTDWTSDTTFAAPTNGVVRLEVRDGRGGASGAVLRIAMTTPMEPMPAEDMGTGDEADMGDDNDFGGVNITPDKPVCGCASAGESSFWATFAMMVVLVRRRR